MTEAKYREFCQALPPDLLKEEHKDAQKSLAEPIQGIGAYQRYKISSEVVHQKLKSLLWDL